MFNHRAIITEKIVHVAHIHTHNQIAEQRVAKRADISEIGFF